MGSKRKAPLKKKHNRRWVMPLAVVLLVVVALSVAYLAVPKTSMDFTVTVPENVPQELKSMATYYLEIMHNLNCTETKKQMTTRLNPHYNQTDLFTWESSNLTFEVDPVWCDSPNEILNEGKGTCVQWSIVYVSACLSLGYQSRLVAAADTTQTPWTYIHVWAEDYYNGKWVHVDPSDHVWDNPSRYQSWDWGSGLGSTVRVYAFEDGSVVDVTSTYTPH